MTLQNNRRDLARTVQSQTISELYQTLVETGVTRAYIVYEKGSFRVSHPETLGPLAAFIEHSHDFSYHEGVFIGREPGVESVFFAFVHDTRRGLAQGGMRFWKYDSVASVLEDGLRLSQGMTRKNALAGLNWGGGKGIATVPFGFERPDLFDDPEARRALFEGYGRFVASLGGVYYTAEDIGTNTPDMDALLSQNRFTTCVSPAKGGSGNPSAHTALGVLIAMTAAWEHLHGTADLSGVHVSVQGAGNVGRPLIDLLVAAGARVTASDPNPTAIASLRDELPSVAIVDPDEIFDVDADVFAPCAIGAQINVDTIPRLDVELVCGAANNQLAEPADAKRLQDRGITYVPDYLCNRMGIVNCADEWAGYIHDDVARAAERVFPDTLRVLEWAAESGGTTADAADTIADAAAAELHPVIGHRGRRLIDQFIETVDQGDPVHTSFYEHHREDGRLWRSERIERGDEPRSIVPQIISRDLIDDSTIDKLLADVAARAGLLTNRDTLEPLPVLGVHENPAIEHGYATDVKIPTRSLTEIEGKGPETPDVDRYEISWSPSRMLVERGNTVSLRSLVERFGTDATRLALALSLGRNETVLTWENLDSARQTLDAIGSIGLRLREGQAPPAISTPRDDLRAIARSLESGEFSDAAEALVKTVALLDGADFSEDHDAASLATELGTALYPILPFVSTVLKRLAHPKS